YRAGIDAFDLVSGNGHLLVLHDHDQALCSQLIELGKNRLFGALLEDAKLGAALEFPHFGPGVLDGPGGHASEQQGKDSKHVLSECTTPTSPGSKGRVHTINRCVG